VGQLRAFQEMANTSPQAKRADLLQGATIAALQGLVDVLGIFRGDDVAGAIARLVQ